MVKLPQYLNGIQILKLNNSFEWYSNFKTDHLKKPFNQNHLKKSQIKKI